MYEKEDREQWLYFVYVDEHQFYRCLNSQRDFYLLFELTKKNRKSLLKIIQACITHEDFHGIIFIADKNEVLLERLFFLKDLSLKLIKNHKEVGVWGIPYCVMQLIFGAYHFSKFIPEFIPEESCYYSKFTPTYQQDSSLLLPCVECVALHECDGLGSRKENHMMWSYRTSHKYRKIGRNKLFQTDNEKMQKNYDRYCDYIDHSDLTYADRYLYFLKNIDLGSSAYSFSDRFVYHCDFLPSHEYEQELSFLNTHVENSRFLPMLSELINRGEVRRIGYSQAERNGVSRESFYINPNAEDNYYFLNYFNIDLKITFLNKFLGVGIDYYNGKIKSYKIYFWVSIEILLEMHPQYFKQIDIDVCALFEKEHYYVIRLDEKKERVSERIDLIYNEKDRLLFDAYFKYLPFSQKQLNELTIFGFAFEFEAMMLNKMNIYYRNRF